METKNFGQWVRPTKCDDGCGGGCDCDSATCSLQGYIDCESATCSLKGYLNRAPTLHGQLNINDCADGMPTYSGPYEVTPHSYEQTLETAQQLMTDNVTVHEIPYWETSNLSDGLTAYIGN